MTRYVMHGEADKAFRYLKSELRAALSTDEAFFWCLSPGCRSGQLHYEGDIFTCNGCRAKSCTTCGVPWHAGRTCEEKTAAEQAAKECRIKAELAADESWLGSAREQEKRAAGKTVSQGKAQTSGGQEEQACVEEERLAALAGVEVNGVVVGG